jgi:hypothetical protein
LAPVFNLGSEIQALKKVKIRLRIWDPDEKTTGSRIKYPGPATLKEPHHHGRKEGGAITRGVSDGYGSKLDLPNISRFLKFELRVLYVKLIKVIMTAAYSSCSFRREIRGDFKILKTVSKPYFTPEIPS